MVVKTFQDFLLPSGFLNYSIAKTAVLIYEYCLTSCFTPEVKSWISSESVNKEIIMQ